MSMYLGHVCTWLRYIDDILMIWEVSRAKLMEFMEELGNNTHNIHLTYVVDSHEISFLDLYIRLEGGKLVTETYRKETAASRGQPVRIYPSN